MCSAAQVPHRAVPSPAAAVDVPAGSVPAAREVPAAGSVPPGSVPPGSVPAARKVPQVLRQGGIHQTDGTHQAKAGLPVMKCQVVEKAKSAYHVLQSLVGAKSMVPPPKKVCTLTPMILALS